jgi:hypothetical protein
LETFLSGLRRRFAVLPFVAEQRFVDVHLEVETGGVEHLFELVLDLCLVYGFDAVGRVPIQHQLGDRFRLCGGAWYARQVTTKLRRFVAVDLGQKVGFAVSPASVISRFNRKYWI